MNIKLKNKPPSALAIGSLRPQRLLSLVCASPSSFCGGKVTVLLNSELSKALRLEEGTKVRKDPSLYSHLSSVHPCLVLAVAAELRCGVPLRGWPQGWGL